MAYATVHGSPGARVRAIGLALNYWPFLVALAVFGWLLHAAFPVHVPRAAAGLLMLALAFLAAAALDVCGRRFGRFLKGARGEEIVGRELALLPEGWTVFHGVPRAGFEAMSGGSDFDHVVLGPGALFVIETKNWDGPVRVEAGSVTIAGRPVRRSPVAQVRRETVAIARSLRGALPPDLPVTGIVCFAGNGLVPDRADVDLTPLCNVRALRELLLASPTVHLASADREKIEAALLGD